VTFTYLDTCQEQMSLSETDNMTTLFWPSFRERL